MEREGEKQTDSRGGGERGKGKKLSGPSEEEYQRISGCGSYHRTGLGTKKPPLQRER